MAVVLSSLAILTPIVVVVVCHAVVVGGIVIVGSNRSCWGRLRCDLGLRGWLHRVCVKELAGPRKREGDTHQLTIKPP